MALVRNAVSSTAQSVLLSPSTTSYFSTPAEDLDPVLFEGNHLRAPVRLWMLRLIHSILAESPIKAVTNTPFLHPESWTRIWVAGSGVSYQWEANGDLDLMVGVDYVEFRRANPAYAGLTDSEIAALLNQLFFDELSTSLGDFPFNTETVHYEVTAYVNRGVSNHRDGIKSINPYAAYDVTDDEWAVVPTRAATQLNPAWEMTAERDRQFAADLVQEYSSALTQVQNATNPAHRTNAESYLNRLMDAASGLYDELHEGRRAAFGPAGAGYADFHNYRWQAGKRNGVVQATRKIRQYLRDAQDQTEFETYGTELPDTDTLIRRSLTHRAAP